MLLALVLFAVLLFAVLPFDVVACAVVPFTLAAERLGAGVEGAEDPEHLGLVHAENAEAVRQRVRVRGVLRAEAAVATSRECRAEGATSGQRDRPETGRPVSDRDAERSATLALDTHAVCRNARAAALDERGQNLQELFGVDRAAVQLIVDGHVCSDRRGALEGLDVLRVGVHDGAVLGDVSEVAQRLDAATRGAGTDRDQEARGSAYLLDALGISGRGHRPLDERDVVWTLDHRAGGFREVGDLHRARQRDELCLLYTSPSPRDRTRSRMPSSA